METKKQKIIKVLKRIGIGLSIGFNFLFLLAIIIGSVGNKKQVNCCLAESDNVVEKLDIKQDNKRYVSYNDEFYTITFSAEELNNYNFDNFNTYIFSNFSSTDSVDILISKLVIGSYTITVSDSYFVEVSGFDNLSFSISQGVEPYYVIDFNYNSVDDVYYHNNKFLFFDGDSYTTFNDSVTFYFNSSSYSSVKTSIELDIQANSGTINDGIFETLTSGVVAFVGSIGAGISSMVGVFYDSANSQLTTIGLLSVIVVAVSLAYFLFRLIIGLIRMRG